MEEQTEPAASEPLVFMTRLLQLAVSCRAMLRDRRFHFPEAPRLLLREFYPILTNYVMDVLLREPGAAGGRVFVGFEVASQPCSSCTKVCTAIPTTIPTSSIPLTGR